MRGWIPLALGAALVPNAAAAQAGNWCPLLKNEGVIDLPVNPAFLESACFDNGDGTCTEGLSVTSFFNTVTPPPGSPAPVAYDEGDQVLRIHDVFGKRPSEFTSDDFERLTDQNLPTTGVVPGGPPFPVPLTPGDSWFINGKTVWPNEASHFAAGPLPFEALVVAQGFQPAPKAGRLTIIDLSNPDENGTYPEYIVHQSTNEVPRFYHGIEFVDMDNDGDQDIVTVRSGFAIGNFAMMGGPQASPPSGELVWFANPGADADFATATWTETVLNFVPFGGPDIQIAAHDFDGDGVVELLATAFFEALPPPPVQTMLGDGRILIFGAPNGFTSWAGVSAFGPMQPRMAVVNADQGAPFDIEIVDLNLDGKMDLLATNHQPDGIAFTSTVPGRVYAIEQPLDGDLFGGEWPVHVLVDNIRPNPNPDADRRFPGRLAPGGAKAFAPISYLEGGAKPWIVVGGDEASEVWLLAPRRPRDCDHWGYRVASIFDVERESELYPTGTQEETEEGRTISTIGAVAVGYDDWGIAKLFVPVFEGRDIHVLSMDPTVEGERIKCENGRRGRNLRMFWRWIDAALEGMD